LAKMAVKPPVDEIKPGIILRKSDQTEPGFNFVQMMTPYGSITLHRKDMLRVLTDNLPPDTQFHSHFSKRLASYEQDSGTVSMRFADGTTACADVLVGADGVRSATRSTMYAGFAKAMEKNGLKKAEQLITLARASWTGTFGYRALVETKTLLSEYPGHQSASNPMIYCGKDKHVVTYPISQGHLVNIVAFVTVPGGEGKELNGPAMVDVTKQEVLDQYIGWEPEVRNLLKCVEKPSRWAISHMRGLPTYVDGRVALLGDSAHAMTTHLGAGAGQSIEDAFILGQIFAHRIVTTSNIPEALKIYDMVRRPFGNGVVELSRATGFLYEFNGLPEHIDGEKIRNGSIEELEKLGAASYENWKIQWIDLPDVQLHAAEDMLMQLGGRKEQIQSNL